MASSDVWLPPWVIITISISTLFVIITIVFYCICWGQKRIRTPKFYILDETSGLQTSSMSEFAQNSISNVRLLRSSESKGSKNEPIFTSNNLQYYKMEGESTSELDLLDSFDASHSFRNSTLQLDNESLNTTRDELYSCRSNDSQCTYYTTIPPLGRTSSRGTFVSVEFSSDTETLID